MLYQLRILLPQFQTLSQTIFQFRYWKIVVNRTSCSYSFWEPSIMLDYPHIRYIFITRDDSKRFRCLRRLILNFAVFLLESPVVSTIKGFLKNLLSLTLSDWNMAGRSVNSLWCSTFVLRPVKTTIRWAEPISRIHNSGEKPKDREKLTDNYGFLDGGWVSEADLYVQIKHANTWPQ